MPQVIDEIWLPATITAPPMTDEQFTAFCAENPDYFIEMTAGERYRSCRRPTRSPAHATRNRQTTGKLGGSRRPRDRHRLFRRLRTPSGARRSPDAAWTLNSRLPQNLKGYWRLSPDFVIELRSGCCGFACPGRAREAERYLGRRYRYRR